MLEGLDAVDWSKVEHAYGPATDVPGLLRAVATGDAKQRKAALDAFDASVNHQGWVTPAAVPATPFVLELWRAGIEPVRLTVLLADLASGGFHGNYAVSGLDTESIPPEARPLRDAIVEACAELALGLVDKDAKVRAASAVALGVLSERRDAGRAALRARLDAEKSQGPLACAILALALLDSSASSASDVARFEALAGHESPLIQLAARIAVAQISPTRDHALAALAAAKGRPEREKDVPWNEGRLVELAERVAVDAIRRAGDFSALSDLVEAIGLMRVAPHALELLFGPYTGPACRPPEPLAPGELTPDAAKFVRLAAEAIEAMRRRNNSFFDPTLFTNRGLHDVVRLAGLRPSRTLDGRGGGGELLWRIARKVRDGRAPPEAWTASLRSLSVGEREDVVRDFVQKPEHHTPSPYLLSIPWPAGRFGYGAEVESWEAYDALVLGAARELPLDRLIGLMEWAVAAKPFEKLRILGLVDAYTEALGEEPPDLRFDPVVTDALFTLHSLGGAPRRIFARIPAPRREALVLARPEPFNLLVSTADGAPFGVYFRWAWSFADLAPTQEVARSAAGSLVGAAKKEDRCPWVAEHYREHDAAIADAVVPRLTAFFRAFGEAGRAAIEEAAPRADSFTRGVLLRARG